MLIFRIDPPPKRCSLLWSFAYVAHWCNIVQVHRFDTSPQHRLHLGPPLANKALTWAQLGPTWPNMVQLGCNLAPTWACLGATSAQVELHTAFNTEDIAGPIRNPQNTPFYWRFLRFFVSIHAFPMLGPTLRSCRQRVPS